MACTKDCLYRSGNGDVKRSAGSYAPILTFRGEAVESQDRVVHVRSAVCVLLYGDLSGPGALGPAVWVTHNQPSNTRTIESPGNQTPGLFCFYAYSHVAV